MIGRMSDAKKICKSQKFELSTFPSPTMPAPPPAPPPPARHGSIILIILCLLDESDPNADCSKLFAHIYSSRYSFASNSYSQNFSSA